MRHFDLRHSAVTMSLLGGIAMIAACSTGSGSASGTGGSGAGTGGTSATGSGGSTGGGSGGNGGATGGGTGGMASGDGGVSGPSVCDGAGTRILAMTDVKVDNFEGAMLDPGWTAFADTCQPGPAPTCTTTPANAFMMMQVAPGADGTAHAGHYAGMGVKTPAKGGYGAGAVFNAAIDMTAGIYCVDVSAFDGVTFWAKGATAGAKITFNFVLPETNQKMFGGDCPDTSTSCFLHPQKAITLTTDWAQYSVTFAEAVPVTGTARVHGKIQQIAILTGDTAWDFSIDEIQYYKGTPPTTPVPTGADGGI